MKVPLKILSPARPVRAAGALLALVVVLAACGSASTGAPSSPPASTPPATGGGSPAASGGSPATGGDAVTIKGFAFAPATLTVAVGTTVTWTNQDSTGHTVTADDGSFDSKALANGKSFSQTFATAGTFAYHCSIHPSMTATVVVH